jgi:NAD(P)-dependent dehydrogenase (short-subunit alcohol dehydrogenase family)
MRLKDKVAVVTGAGAGIGRAIALLFSEEGARVVVAEVLEDRGLETVSQIREKGNQALFIKTDVRDLNDIQRAVSQTVKELGRIDILVNNAGVLQYLPFVQVTEKDWDRIIDINLKGTFFFAQAAAKEMIRAQRGGKIINMSSIASEVAIEFQSHYMASKGGVRMLTKGMALELAPYGINVNALAPGTIETEMTRQDLEDPTIREEAIEAIPLGRIGIPLDVARAALFLATEESDYITGEMIFVEGGYVIR